MSTVKPGVAPGSMRQMSNRKKAGKLARSEGAKASRQRQREGDERPPDCDAEIDDTLDVGGDDSLIDRGDGVRVVRRGGACTFDEVASNDLPDEPPVGWCET